MVHSRSLALVVALGVPACSLLTDASGIATSSSDSGDSDGAIQGDSNGSGNEAGTSILDASAETTLSKSAAYQEAVVSDKPVAYFPLDEKVGDGVVGDVVSGKVFSLIGAPQFGIPGIAGTAAYFGDMAGVALGDMFDLDGSRHFTIEFWMNVPLPPAGGYRGLLSKRKYADPLEGWTMYVSRINDAGLGRVTLERNWAPAANQFAWSEFQYEDRWLHVVFTHDERGIECYVDARRSPDRAPYAGNAGPPDTSQPLFLASSLRGAVDELAFYDRALPTDRIAAHFALGH